MQESPGRPADRPEASTGDGSRIAGQAVPGLGASAGGAQVPADLAGDVALQAADDLLPDDAGTGATPPCAPGPLRSRPG
jgi:hypothetical protein